MQVYDYRKLKRACILFGILIVLLNCVEWGIEDIGIKLTEVLFLTYLVKWLDRDAMHKNKRKLLFFCMFMVGTGFGSLINNAFLELMITIITVLAAMLYLYSLRIEVTYDRIFLYQFFSAVIYFPFAYVYDFLEPEKYTLEEKRRNQKLINGLFMTFSIVLIGLIPLYMSGDQVFAGWIEIIIGWVLNNIFEFSMSIIFGWIPAMLVFSYMKGICEECVDQNIPDSVFVAFDKQKMFFNRFSVNAVFIGSSIVNFAFAMTQLVYFFNIEKNYNDITNIGSMYSIFLAIIINVAVIVVLALIIKEKELHKNSVSLASFNIYYIISIFVVCLSFGWRYVSTVFMYGLKGIWTIWGMGFLVFLAIIALSFVHVLFDYTRLVKIICYGAACLFIILNISIPEYWIGKINVKIYDYKYSNGLLVNSSEELTQEDISKIVVTTQDLDIEYIKTLNLWAVPSLLDVIEVSNIYNETGQSVGAIAEKYIVEILEEDLAAEDIGVINSLDSEEQIQYLLTRLEINPDYRLPGQKKLILDMLRKTYKNEI